MMVDRYPAHPRTPDAFRWLIRHNCSSEARRRNELGQFVVVGQLEYGQPKAGSPCSRCRLPKTKTMAIRAKRRRSAPRCPASRRARRDGGSRWPARRRRASGIRGRSTWKRAWRRSAPCSRTIRRCSSRSKPRGATLGEFEAPKKWYADFVSRQPEGPWRNAAAAELWLTNRVGAPPKPVAYCRYTEERPYLDGKLDDACWQARTGAGAARSGRRCGRRLQDRRPHGLRSRLLVSGRALCTAGRPAEQPAKPRTHDADLRGHDRVSLLLDLDRDYATAFHFEVDQRGCIADDCWGDKTWDPRWFVAVHNGDTEWTVEAAIPLAALTGDSVTPGRAWCCNLIRTVPGKGVRAWSLPAESPEESPRWRAWACSSSCRTANRRESALARRRREHSPGEPPGLSHRYLHKFQHKVGVPCFRGLFSAPFPCRNRRESM